MTSTLTSAAVSAAPDDDEIGVAHDLYREIHKGIRYALFHTTMHAGRLDVGDADDVDDLLCRCTDLVELLHLHHHHEDGFVQPLLDVHAPALAAAVGAQHDAVESGLAELRRLGEQLTTVSHLGRDTVAHRLYLHLSRFTGEYLDHQLLEELQVMPALCAAVPPSELESLHAAIVQSIAPPVMADCMSVMLPAMNVGERAEMLGAMSMAPPEVFAVFRRAAKGALTPAEFAEVATRIGLN